VVTRHDAVVEVSHEPGHVDLEEALVGVHGVAGQDGRARLRVGLHESQHSLLRLGERDLALAAGLEESNTIE
jgi:hypothetical protein